MTKGNKVAYVINTSLRAFIMLHAYVARSAASACALASLLLYFHPVWNESCIHLLLSVVIG